MRPPSTVDIWSRSRRHRRGFVIGLIVVMVIGGVLAVDAIRRHIEGEADLASDRTFYRIPDPLPEGEPGDIVRLEEIDSAPLGSTAWRVIYHTRDIDGSDVAASAVVVVPDTPAPGRGRAVIAWGHPTTGAATQCAPSLDVDPFQLIEGLHEFLLEGYAVVAADYPGLGVAGASSYLLGVPESNSILDAVRAAHDIDAAEIGTDVILWGHSQGGQAVLFAAERAERYAPDLTVRGVAVAAPAADLTELMSDDIVNVSGVTIASYAIPAYEAAYADQYRADELSAILTPGGAAATPQMADMCLLSQNKEIHAIADPLVGRYVTSDPATTEPWKTLLQENSAGSSPIRVPVFVGQGLADELVKPAATEDYVALLCQQDTRVGFHRYPGVNHGLAAYAALPDMLGWLSAVSAGHPPPSTCR
ncbi:alpha/beta fold hydrolase [Microbacterium hydrocarbonoxydans]|uniref:alpha/beta fold hydrolase n=1 Tax=Microbacterium hydrocarbonoxydans TaxID=273678 RepID=UPI00203E978F|nr:alpha/beta fold hydrolase [Microbacterium hydrocarbonoxydans]MCM3780344.1 lipase family protein [Microbacterium hydrocarbonoxydans]